MELIERARHAVRVLALMVFALCASLQPATLQAQEAPLPPHGPDQHLGVVTCAGSTCHGATSPSDLSSVLQNEFVIWHRQDRHAQAYKVLLNERSRRIARNLGLPAAEKADICLDCHANNVAPQLRGPRFQISDGVGCEACHGGAQRYLGPHLAADATHAKNVEHGMYPTSDPAARAALCLSCHLGTRDRLATHRIMGAGHPRLSFELDTFSDIQPPHHRVDDDYHARKGAPDGVRLWVSGQFAAAGAFLDLFQAYQSRPHGLFPELSFFDCHGCHRSLHEQRWQPRPGLDLAPGSVRLLDANLLMLRQIVRVAAPARQAALDQALAQLHKATTTDMPATLAAAQHARTLIGEIERSLRTRGFGAADMSALLASLVTGGVHGEYSDYAGAEQAAMALGSLINAMRASSAISAARAGELEALLDRVYEVLADDTQYEPARLVAAMQALQGAL